MITKWLTLALQDFEEAMQYIHQDIVPYRESWAIALRFFVYFIPQL